MKHGLLIGIDGGGTHSVGVAAYPNGQVVAVAHGGGMNFFNIGIPAVRVCLEELIEALLSQCGHPPIEGVCAGMSALDAPADDATLARFTGGLLSPGQLDMQSDVYIALMGLTLGEPGLIVICGTGSMLLMMDGEGRQHVNGGWGYLLGDAGSGYSLAREGIAAAVEQAECNGPETALTADALSHFHIGQLRQLIDRVYNPQFTPDQMADFARCVLTRAQQGDAPARAIVARNMAHLARQAACLAKTRPEVTRLGLYGGIFRHSELACEFFRQELARLSPALEVLRPEYPPELGAIIHLMRRQGICTAQTLQNLKFTYAAYSASEAH